MEEINPEDYRHNPVHYAVAVADHVTLSSLVSTLPRLSDPKQIHTETDSLAQERIAERIAADVDRRDVPFRETPLHLAVRLSDAAAAKILTGADADGSLRNSAGWDPLQEALCRRNYEIARILHLHEVRLEWYKWRRRLPRFIAAFRRMRDFYMEMSFHFESSIIPFIGKIAPSDTYKIWKRDGNLRVDTSLAGFDGMKIQREDKSYVFLGEGDSTHNVPAGSLLVLRRRDSKIWNAFKYEDKIDEATSRDYSKMAVCRGGMDFSKAELVGRMNWRWQQKTEKVGEWKAKSYDFHNVIISSRSVEVVNDVPGSGCEQVLPVPVDLKEDHHHGFPTSGGTTAAAVAPQTKEKKSSRSYMPSVWLTEKFPLKMEELLPLLDVLANKVKAVQKMREMLATKFPPGTFPVKIELPVIPTVRVVITFTKFVELAPKEQFYTPVSSPKHFSSGSENQKQSQSHHWSSSWLRRSKEEHQPSLAHHPNPFAIPEGYTWKQKKKKKKPRVA